MRRFIIAAMLSGIGFSAHAADMADLPILRGPIGDAPVASVANWQGVYVGGHYVYGASQLNLANATRGLTAHMLENTAIEAEGGVSNWSVLTRTSTIKGGIGGFAGYNMQWDDVILGVEGNYSHGTFGGSQTGRVSRSFDTSNGYTNAVTYVSTAGLNLTDMASFRARAGYSFSAFLPYAFVGAAFGIGDVTRTSHVFGAAVNTNAQPGFQNVPFDLSASASQNARFLYGYSAGFGVDVLLIGGLFGRLEYEYLKFAAPIDTSVNTIRAGLGYKF